MVQSKAEGEPTRIRVLQLLLALLHDGLEDSGGDVTITRTHSDHTACQSGHTSHLITHTHTQLVTVVYDRHLILKVWWSYLHAGLWVSHDRQKQWQDVFSVRSCVGQTQPRPTQRVKGSSLLRDHRLWTSAVRLNRHWEMLRVPRDFVRSGKCDHHRSHDGSNIVKAVTLDTHCIIL